MFQSERSIKKSLFQSPRSGKFESNNELRSPYSSIRAACFNPLDRGNLNQIIEYKQPFYVVDVTFQSPRSGKFESNVTESYLLTTTECQFQSPRSGKFESNS